MDNIDCDDCNDYKPKVFSKPLQPVEKEPQDLIYLTDPNNNCGNETKTQMVCRLMAEILEEGGDDTVKNGWISMKSIIDNYESIDKEMVERLNSIFSNDVIKKEQFDDIVKAIGQGSTVVYFKSAQLFKVYKKTELETLLGGQIRTIYKQLDESYEVVSNDSKQKIIILGDVSLADSIEQIKTYIVEFMIGEGIKTFTYNDIVCYKGRESIEIIINDYYVENQSEHDEVVKKLLKYIFQQEKNTKIVQKINTNTFSEFEGIKMISMPSNKQLLATDYIEPLLTMISNVTQCSGFKNQITLNVTNIINDHSVNTTNNIVNAPTDENSINIYEFIKHIRDEKPEWYKESTWVKKDILLEKYNELYEPVHKRSFDVMFKNKLYISEKRKMIDKVRYMFVELFKISEL